MSGRVQTKNYDILDVHGYNFDMFEDGTQFCATCGMSPDDPDFDAVHDEGEE